MKEKKRLLQMLYYLSESEQPLRSADLAKLTGISVRTVKGDAQELADLATASGATLCSKKGTGFWLEITDPEAFTVVKEQLGYQFSNYTYTSEYENKVNVFTRRLLVSDHYVTAQMLADELWLARSTIKPFIGEVRNLSEKFRLKLISKASYGLKLEGPEVNKRFCMLELYLNHDTRTSTMIGNREFRDYLDMDKQTARLVRNTVLHVLRSSGFSIRDHMSHRLIRYMPLAYNRTRHGYHAVMPEEARQLLEPLPLRKVAARLLEEMETVFPGMPRDEDEVLAVEYLLLLFFDPIRYEGFRDDFGILVKKITPVVRCGVDGMINTWDLSEQLRCPLERSMLYAFIPVYAQLMFPGVGYSFIGKEVENNGISSSPLCVALARTFLEAVSRKYGSRVPRFAALYLAFSIFLPVLNTEYPNHRINLLVTNRMGSYGGAVLKDKLVDRFGKQTFEQIRFIELYEGREIDLTQYDFIIGNHDEMYIHYDIPYLKVNAIPTREDFIRIHEKVITGRYDILKTLEEVDLHVVMPEAPAFKSPAAFARGTANLFAKSAERKKELAEIIMRTRGISVWDKTLFLIVPDSAGEGNIIGFWEYDRGYLWENRVFNNVVYLQVSMKKSATILKAAEQILRNISLEESRQMLRKQPDHEGLLELIKNAV